MRLAEYKRPLYRIGIGAALLLCGVLLPFAAAWPAILLFAAGYLTVGGEYLRRAAKNIARGKIFDENFLMTLATVCAFLIGEYAEGVTVMLFYAVGELFQEIAVRRTRSSVTALMDIRPEYAVLVLPDGSEKRVQPEDIAPGDILRIIPGEKVPVDAVVAGGRANMDMRSLTGESVPKAVAPGDSLFSGSIDTDGVITARAVKTYGESTVKKILDLVENSADKKAKAESFITKFAKYYTPAVVAAAACIAFLPPAFTGFQSFSEWLYRALIFLMISCPCAVVLSVPLGYFGGIGGASKRGILVKGANYFDALGLAGVAVFDKTGTLTRGTFSVVKTVSAENITAESLLYFAAMAEKYSSHPIALSLRAHYGKEPDAASDYAEIAGKGISAVYAGKKLLAGNARLMEENGFAALPADEYGTAVHVAAEGRYLGYILISDEIRPEAFTLCERLKSSGVKRLVMLTGDGEKPAAYVAGKLGFDEYRHSLLPQDKVGILEELKARYPGETVLFVGDGINDAPVLAVSDIGIAMGAMGSDAAIESADVVLLGDNVEGVDDAIRISRRTRRIVFQNVVFAVVCKLAIMALGLFGIAALWMAIFADVGVSLLAVLNSARSLRRLAPAPAKRKFARAQI
jgi:Cd2+/Zn2+-exporting ATPase